MADVIGPGRQLPGSLLAVPNGMMCDYHPNVLAVKRVVGETDSFGSEVEDLCQECYDQHVHAMATTDSSGRCDWCKQEKPELHSHRDIEEGSHGPVYQVCRECIDAERARWKEESGRDDDDDWEEFPPTQEEDEDERS